MAPKVSICIPTYNRKDYLRETIDSVFAQTYKDYEVVVVDDGSTDGTADMLKNLDLPIRYYRQENSGDAVARNKLIKLADGKYITFIDSDDLLIHDAVERMINVMEAEGGETIVYGPYIRIDENGQVYGRYKNRQYSGYITKYLFQNIFVYSCGSMFSKKVLETAGGFDKSLPTCSDYDLWLRLSLKYRFIALAEPTFKRRRHTKNLSAISSENRMIELKVLERFYYERGGDSVVPKRIAMRRLSREEYRVAVAAIKEGKLQVAREYLKKSFRHRPNPKSAVMLLPALLKWRSGP
jgi:glycosyltransferase involved in cell wall biosynthesis